MRALLWGSSSRCLGRGVLSNLLKMVATAGSIGHSPPAFASLPGLPQVPADGGAGRAQVREGPAGAERVLRSEIFRTFAENIFRKKINHFLSEKIQIPNQYFYACMQYCVRACLKTTEIIIVRNLCTKFRKSFLRKWTPHCHISRLRLYFYTMMFCS